MRSNKTAAEGMAANQRNWDERVAIHMRDRSGIYQFDKFWAGDTSITPIDDAEIGDVRGLRLAHLQCHFGLDTIRLARLGAKATGLDFSAAAIAQAKGLAQQTGVEADFVQGNVYDAAKLLEPGSFDMVYVSWGALCWLPDIKMWANTVAALLKVGGRLYLADGHPALMQSEMSAAGEIVHAYGQGDALSFEESETYAGDGAHLSNTETHEWMHGISDILGGIIGAGLTITRFSEHDTIPWPHFESMEQAPGNMYRLPNTMPRLPLSFSLDATKSSI